MFLPAEGSSHLQQATGVHQGGVLEARVPGGHLPQHVQLKAVENLWALGPLCGEYVQV